jgi:hypothetical protein
MGRGNEFSSKCPVNYLRGRVMPEDLLSILKIENPSPEGTSMVFLLLRQSAGVSKNSISQISNNKQMTMTEIRNPKPLDNLK